MADGASSPAGRGAALDPVWAGIVVFHPDPDHLRRLVAGLRGQAAGVVLFLNSPLEDALRRDVTAAPGVHVIEAAGNLGIGAGLNLIALAACLRGAEGVVFFDQDSSPPPDLIDRLRAAWAEIEAAGRRPAVVSPRLVTEPGAASKAPTYRYGDGPESGAARQVAFVPTSGSLVAIDALRRTGFFRADFFIDGIDVEWSFRAAHRGYSCWVHTTCTMPHTVGSGVIGLRWLNWSMPKQRPFRMYCVVRNTLYGLRLRHIPLGWKVRQVAYLPVQALAFALHHRLRRRVVSLLLLGVVDGLAGRLGPPRGLADRPSRKFDGS